MQLHADLPLFFKDFLKPFDYKELAPKKSFHAWNTVPREMVLTKEGLEWFFGHNFKITPRVQLFRAPKNCEGPIHLDSWGENPNEAKFNFVLEGHGEMQWVTNIKESPNREWNAMNNKWFYSYDGVDISSFDIADTWTGSMGLVRTSELHRVITADSERYCLSIRTVNPIKFDQTLIDIFK